MMERAELWLHHVGQAVPAIEAAAEVQRRRFGYVVCSGVIHDPLQTALVQFLRQPGMATYLELVAPDGPGSKLSNAVKRGGGLNHLCYTAERLEEAIAHLEALGMKLISDPKPGAAFAGRRVCWLLGGEPLPVELVERRGVEDECAPGMLSS